MPYVSDTALHEMLKQMPAEQAKRLGDIVAGKATHQVRCMSDKCNGEAIAYLYIDGTDNRGRIKYRVEPSVTDVKSMKLLVSRHRLDGQLGFLCRCGNDSQLASHERGIIGSNTPTRDDLEEIYGRLQKNAPNYPEVDGVKYVDGFQIERLGE